MEQSCAEDDDVNNPGMRYSIVVPYFKQVVVNNKRVKRLHSEHYPPRDVFPYSTEQAIEILGIFDQMWVARGCPKGAEPYAIQCNAEPGDEPCRFTLRQICRDVKTVVGSENEPVEAETEGLDEDDED